MEIKESLSVIVISINFQAPRHYSFNITENESLKLGEALTVKMKKRHSMPNLMKVQYKQQMKQSETFESKLRLRK